MEKREVINMENKVVWIDDNGETKTLKDRVLITDVEDNLENISLMYVRTCAHCGNTEKQDVIIFRPHFDDFEGITLGWTVVFSGAIDFEGNKRDMLKRYPEFKGITCDL
jgi:hypothetical protein